MVEQRIIRVPLKRDVQGPASCPEEGRCQLEVIANDPADALQLSIDQDGRQVVRVGLLQEGAGCDVTVRVGLIAGGETEYLWMYIYIPNTAFYDLILDLSTGLPLDLDSFVDLPGSPARPTANPVQRDLVWYNWFWYNFEYADELVQVPLNAVKKAPISDGTDNASAWDYDILITSETTSPYPPHSGTFEYFDQRYKADPDTFVYREANQTDDGTYFTGTARYHTKYSPDYGYGYDLYDTNLATLAKTITIGFSEEIVRTLSPSWPGPATWVEQDHNYWFRMDMGSHAYELTATYELLLTTATGLIEDSVASGMFPEFQAQVGNAANLWTELDTIGEQYYVFVAGCYQGLEVYDVDSCPSCSQFACWYADQLATGVLDPTRVQRNPGGYNCLFGNPVQRYIVSPAAVVVPFSAVPDVVPGENVSVADLFGAADTTKSQAVSQAIMDLIDTVAAIWPIKAANVPTVGLSGARLMRRATAAEE